MVEDALASNRTIGMVLLKPGYEADYRGRPPIYPLGCTGTIVEQERLDDGRYNILLLGQSRFRVMAERDDEPYRLADGAALHLKGDVAPTVLVNGLCQGLDLPPVEKLSLLGCDTVDSRARRLLEILEFHALERTAGRSGTLH